MSYSRGVLTIDRDYRQVLESLGLTTLEAFRKRFGTGTAVHPSVEIVPTRLQPPDREPLDVFYKQYNYARPDWRFFGRRSKAECEFRNFANLRDLGIRVADRVACGAWRDHLGKLKGAFILTRAVPEARTLLDFFRNEYPNRSTPEMRALRSELGRQLAQMVQAMHQGHFFHNDLYWRNVLVTWHPPGEPQLWWIDCPRGGFSRLPYLSERHAIKDLAALDRWAHQLCSGGERFKFVREYLGKAASRDEAKSLARRTVAYRLRRWPGVHLDTSEEPTPTSRLQIGVSASESEDTA